jgi:hypothetical protein
MGARGQPHARRGAARCGGRHERERRGDLIHRHDRVGIEGGPRREPDGFAASARVIRSARTPAVTPRRSPAASGLGEAATAPRSTGTSAAPAVMKVRRPPAQDVGAGAHAEGRRGGGIHLHAAVRAVGLCRGSRSRRRNSRSKSATSASARRRTRLDGLPRGCTVCSASVRRVVSPRRGRGRRSCRRIRAERAGRAAIRVHLLQRRGELPSARAELPRLAPPCERRLSSFVTCCRRPARGR